MTEEERVIVSKRNRSNKAKGARWELMLRKGFREAKKFLAVEGLKRTGAKDEGDLYVLVGDTFVVIEAKDKGKFEPASFIAQAELEAKHFAENRGLPPERVMPIAIVKRRGCNWRKAYVLTTVEHYFGLEGR